MRPAAAAAVCDVSAFGCPSSGTCVVNGVHSIGNQCVLDFQGKSVELRGTFKGATVGDSFSVVAGAFTVNGGKLLSTGDGVTSGGNIDVESGTFSMIGTGPRIDTSAGAGGGSVTIDADDVAISSGVIITDGGSTASCGSAGDVTVTARVGGVLLNGSTTTISAGTGGYDCSGGLVYVDGASLDVRKSIDASGGNPPGITLTALSGNVVVRAGAVLDARGRGSDADFGNDAGAVELLAPLGLVDFEGAIEASGSGADGGGGDVVLEALATLSIEGDVQATGPGTFASGGGIEITSGGLLTLDGKLNVSGGSQGDGGFIDVVSGGGVTLVAGESLSADGGSFGAGSIDLRSTGAVVLGGDLLARGGSGGDGGFIDVRGCQVTLSATADVDPGTSGSAGSIDLTGGSLVLASTARLEARPCPSANCNSLTLRSGAPTIHPLAVLDPVPQIILNPSLTPCCGNGTIEGPGQPLDVGEQCDDGNTSFCDGCSRWCTLEPSPACAPDGNECTLDCSPTQGCNYKPQTNVPCSDEPGGNVCTEDVCVKGVCTHPPNDCDDGIHCTVNTCDPVLGCQATPSDARCNDRTTCTTEVCDPLSGDPVSGCVYTPEPDGIACDDGDLCTTGDRCLGGACEPAGPPVSCEDGDPCTWNDCMPALGCVNSEDPDLCPCSTSGVPAPAGTACADGNKCTQDDSCNGLGACVPGDFCPDDGDPCTGEICYLGICAHPDTLCPGSGTCIEGQPCSDGSACTTGICHDGVCESDPVACGDGDPCTGEEGCHETLGCRQLSYPPLEAPECSDVVVDAFSCYRTRRAGGATSVAPIEDVAVADAFWSVAVDLKRPTALCLPLDVAGGDPEAVTHEDGLEALRSKAVAGSPKFTKRVGLEVTNVLGTLTLDAKRPDLHLVPTTGSVAAPPALPLPPDPDAFACYSVATTRGTPKFTPIAALPLEDRFGAFTVALKKPTRLCLPADVAGASPNAPSHPQHLLCYQAQVVATEPGYALARNVFTANFLHSGKVDAVQLKEICLPSEVSP